MTDWQDATDPVQPVRERERVRYVRARAHWQKQKLARGEAPGALVSLQGHDAAVEPDFDEGE